MPGAVFDDLRNQWRRDFAGWVVDSADGYVGRGLPGCEVSDAIVGWQIRDMLRASLRAVIETNVTMVEADFRDDLRQLSVPTLIVHGDHDVSAPIEITSNRTAELVPHNTPVVYENGPHGLYLTHRDRLTDDLVDFVKR